MSQGFDDDFSRGINSNMWGCYAFQWGAGNNGCVPEYVRLQQDRVVMWDGTDKGTKNVVALWGHGDKITSTPIIPAVAGITQGGARNRPVTRVGSCMVSREYYGVGTYEVDAKVWWPTTGTTAVQGPPAGTVFSAWTFHYEEHRAAPGDTYGTRINPNDLLYQPQYKQGAAGAYYSTMNSEIDAPEMGVSGRYNSANFNTWITETKYDIKELPFPTSIVDGRYHRFSWAWRNKAVPLPNLRDDQVGMAAGYYRIKVDGVYPEYVGFALQKRSDGKYYAIVGEAVDFYVDGKFIRTSTTNICPAQARIIIGNWFASWAGPANWEFCRFTIARVGFTPPTANDVVVKQNMNGIATIPGSTPLVGGHGHGHGHGEHGHPKFHAGFGDEPSSEIEREYFEERAARGRAQQAMEDHPVQSFASLGVGESAGFQGQDQYLPGSETSFSDVGNPMVHDIPSSTGSAERLFGYDADQ